MAIATIIITATRSGTPSTLVVNRGPAGPQGDAGPAGEDGLPGADGTPGTNGSDANVTTANVKAALSIQSKSGSSTGLAAVGVADITGLTGYNLEANTWYKLELNYLWTSTSSNFQINFVTSGTLARGGTTPALGQSQAAVTVISSTYFLSDTAFALRGSVGENRTNCPFFGWAFFKTGSAGTGKIELQLLSGTTLSTITSSNAVLTKQG